MAAAFESTQTDFIYVNCRVPLSPSAGPSFEASFEQVKEDVGVVSATEATT